MGKAGVEQSKSSKGLVNSYAKQPPCWWQSKLTKPGGMAENAEVLTSIGGRGRVTTSWDAQLTVKAVCSERWAPLKIEPTPLNVVTGGALFIEEARANGGVATADAL